MILTLDAALDGCCAAVVRDGVILAERHQAGGRGSSAVLPEMVHQVLDQAGLAAADLVLIAVTIGPGSFTGVRAALSLAHGIALASGVPVAGVTVGDAIRAACDDPAIWVAIDSKRGRLFLDRGDGALTYDLAEVPEPQGPVVLAGDAAATLARHLREHGHDVRLLDDTAPSAAGIARAALRRPRPALPLYVDAVAARPGAPARPAPV